MSIKVTVHYACNGCDASVDAKAEMRREFRSFSGRDHGIGTWNMQNQWKLVEATAPEGWVPFDPYTNITYCPKCWDSIENGIDKSAEGRGDRRGEREEG